MKRGASCDEGSSWIAESRGMCKEMAVPGLLKRQGEFVKQDADRPQHLRHRLRRDHVGFVVSSRRPQFLAIFSQDQRCSPLDSVAALAALFLHHLLGRTLRGALIVLGAG